MLFFHNNLVKQNEICPFKIPTKIQSQSNGNSDNNSTTSFNNHPLSLSPIDSVQIKQHRQVHHQSNDYLNHPQFLFLTTINSNNHHLALLWFSMFFPFIQQTPQKQNTTMEWIWEWIESDIKGLFQSSFFLIPSHSHLTKRSKRT